MDSLQKGMQVVVGWFGVGGGRESEGQCGGVECQSSLGSMDKIELVFNEARG